MRTFVIGRSQYADIVLADGSVAARHAELTVAGTNGAGLRGVLEAGAEGARYYLADCATETGTWRQAEPGEPWQRVRQEFIGAEEALAFGSHRTTLRQLLVQIDAQFGGGPGAGGANGGRWRPGAEVDPDTGDDLPRGRVERDPLTGEIIRKGV